jgi:hypothetical protein
MQMPEEGDVMYPNRNESNSLGRSVGLKPTQTAANGGLQGEAAIGMLHA